jgi:hypothetical protein
VRCHKTYFSLIVQACRLRVTRACAHARARTHTHTHTHTHLHAYQHTHYHAHQAVAALGSGKGANLVEDYTMTPAAQLQAARTPRAPASQDPLLLEARNIIALNQTDSVLEGGENTPLREAGGFEGLTPKHKVVGTPNVVLTTPYRGASVTPGVAGSAAAALAATPLRDALRINTEGDSSLLTPRSASEKRRAELTKAELREGLANLPKPAAGACYQPLALMGRNLHAVSNLLPYTHISS